MQHKPSTDKFEAKRLGGIVTQTQSIVTPSMQENWQRATNASSVISTGFLNYVLQLSDLVWNSDHQAMPWVTDVESVCHTSRCHLIVNQPT